jgi:hypothetical protein
MHLWGDEDFDWDALNISIGYIMKFWKKWGRIGSHGKEKYGSFRDSPYFFDGTIHSLIYPAYVCRQLPKWFSFHIDYKIIKPIMDFLRITKLVNWYQSIVYNYAIQKMCAKYPHIIDELVAHLDGYTMVKRGIFGNVCGTEIHNKYWTECK